jgi:hypothetical protein
LTNLRPGDDGAVILDAIHYSVGLLQKEPDERLRVLLPISETRDHGSRVKIDDTVASLGRANAVVYTLAFSPALSNILDTGRGNNINEMQVGVNFLDLAIEPPRRCERRFPVRLRP